MAKNLQYEEEIFAIALELHSPDTRSAYLDQACGDDGALRRRVTALLRRHEESQGLLDAPPPGVDETMHLEDSSRQAGEEQVGTQIGPYRLMEQIGEGGMGVVYVAQQERPMLRKVALKIIKPGMDTKEVIARFEAERQALALMDHPNIAKVLDAGATATGRPYFAMELVRGIPITDYCDRKRLSTRQRLQLFVTACQAIQHAHQKGVIHRDVKPSNVLVTEHDGTPLPKVIDFGVAKAINQRLTERTIYTRHQQMIGTPLYMSPEQADLSALDVDTRSDIYSLGVLLYELLTGVTPFDQQRFHKLAYDEMRRVIREEEPPKPSTRISTLKATAETVCERRQTDPSMLRRVLRGELDWVVMKAIEKDRNRRYETANALAADVSRYLRDEPVTACPPSATYQFRKFARRNRALLVTATSFGMVLLAATIVSTWQAGVARRAERIAVAKEKELQIAYDRLRVALNDGVHRALMAGDEVKAAEAIDEAEELEVPAETVSLFRGQLALYYGRADEAIAELPGVAATSVAAQGLLATAAFYAQDYETMDVALAALTNQLDRAGDDLTFEDKLFAGHAMINGDMGRGRELVQRALAERSSSPLAQMIDAVTLAAYAHNFNDISQLQPALESVRNAMRYVDGTPALVSAHHMVQHVALTFGMANEARIDAQRLHAEWDDIKTLPAGRMMLIRLLAGLEDEGERVPQIIRSGGFSITDGEMAHYIPILLHHESPREVRRWIDENQHELGLYGKCGRARLMALLPDGRSEAAKVCIDLMNEHTSFFARTDCLFTLLLTGSVEDVRQRASDFFDSSSDAYWYRKECMRFLAGEVAVDEFLAATAGESRVFRLEALFAIGMHELAEGDQTAALARFEDCDETQAIHSELWWWARAFAKSLRGDSEWTLEVPSSSG